MSTRRHSTPAAGSQTSHKESGPSLEGVSADAGEAPEPPKAEPKAEPAKPKAPDPFFRDPECEELARHRPNCDCKGDARKPIA